MAICPFCGNELAEFDFMCGKCGNELPNTTITTPEISSVQETHMPVTENGYEQSKYGAYDSKLDTSVNKKTYDANSMNKRKGILKVVLSLTIIAVLVCVGYRKIRSLFIKPYQDTVRQAVVAVIENNYDLMISNTVVDYDSMYAEYYGYLYVGLKQLYRQQNEEFIDDIKRTYGDDYIITTTIEKIDDMSGALKDEALERAIKTNNEEFELNQMELDYGDYLKKDTVKKVKRIEVKATIKGSKGSKESDYVVDLAKVDGKMNWQVLFVYEK